MSFSFGTPSSAPASSSLTGGFSFGANKPAAPGFGLTATSQPSTGLFGSTPATSAPAFGATATPAFGSTAPAFGAAAPTFGTTTPAFGATSTAPAFGATSTASAFGATATPAFGATAAPAFGATTAPAFGATTAPAFGATNTLSFGTTGFGAGGLNFGSGTNTSAPTGLTFGAPTATTAATGLGGLGGFGFGATSTTQSSGLSLFPSTSTATTTNSLFGLKPGTTTVTGTQPSTSAAPSLGLGGVSTNASGIGVTGTASDGKSEPPKQTKLPNEITTTVESFKEFVKKQKGFSSEVMRVSIKPLHKVSREAEATLRIASSLKGEVSRARANSKRMRAAAASALVAAETANRDYTPGSELEGPAPPQYIKELISELEQQLLTFRRQMDAADKQMQSSPKMLTEQELTMGIRRMHESLVALAGRLQAVHTQVEAQKEQYLNLRKYILKDPTNVFETPHQSCLDQILGEAEGGRKKVKSGGGADVIHNSAVLSDPRSVLGNMAGPTPFSYVGSAISPYTAIDASGPTWQPTPQPTINPGNTSLNVSFGTSAPADTSSSFQLQKPPGKRGKQ